MCKGGIKYPEKQRNPRRTFLVLGDICSFLNISLLEQRISIILRSHCLPQEYRFYNFIISERVYNNVFAVAKYGNVESVIRTSLNAVSNSIIVVLGCR